MSLPFYPCPIDVHVPNGITDVNDPNYTDELWDLY